MSSRNTILASLRGTQRTPATLPEVPMFDAGLPPALEKFKETLAGMGGIWADRSTDGDLDAQIRARFPDAKVICSAVPEVAGTRRIRGPRSARTERCRCRYRAAAFRGRRDRIDLAQRNAVSRQCAWLSVPASRCIARSGRHCRQSAPRVSPVRILRCELRGADERSIGDGRHRRCPDSRRTGDPVAHGYSGHTGSCLRVIKMNATAIAPAPRWNSRVRAWWRGLHHLPLPEALRGGVVCVVPAILAAVLHDPLLCWSAIAAFWTCLSDPAGAGWRRRATAGVTFGVFGALGSWCAVASSAVPVFTVILTGVVVFIGGLMRSRGAEVGLHALLAAAAFSVAAAFPVHGFRPAAHYASCQFWPSLPT